MKRREAIRNAIMVLGGVVSITSIPALMSACESDTEFESKLFTKKQLSVLQAAIDRIIPETDTPSAVQTGVDRFIEVVLVECFPDIRKTVFLTGLNALIDQKFSTLEPEAQDQLLSLSEQKDDPFFKMLKEFTLIGYFTSEQGVTQNFNYMPVPGRFDGCVDYSKGMKPWRGYRL